MSISRRLDTFRGESKFTTWATRFVIFGVASKMRRRPWWREGVPFEQVDWRVLIARSDLAPEEAAQLRDLGNAMAAAVRDSLSERQRTVFVAVVLEGVPIGDLADDLGSTRNSLYKVLFDARRNMRAALVATGHLPESCLKGAERNVVRIGCAT
jgi:RNA polymerase sigma-70 factor (ECF subfamily)